MTEFGERAAHLITLVEFVGIYIYTTNQDYPIPCVLQRRQWRNIPS